MSSVILSIPEDHLKEFIDLLIFSIRNYEGENISAETYVALLDWCKEHNEYIKELMEE
jgi:hypothetical protein